MELILQNHYPFPYPDNASEAEKEKLSNAATDRTLTIGGVMHFEWKHELTVEFATFEHYKAAKLMTGWDTYGGENGQLILSAKVSGPDGYNHPAIVVGDTAWCGFILTPEGSR